MIATEISTKKAILKLLDELSPEKLVEVLDFVAFLQQRKRLSIGASDTMLKQLEVKGIPASALMPLAGLVAWGGDAVEDAERLYDDA